MRNMRKLVLGSAVMGLALLAGNAMATGEVSADVQPLIDAASATFTAVKVIVVAVIAFSIGAFYVRKYTKGKA